MNNNLAKLLILCSAIIAISGCNKNDKSCFVVETLKTGDDYKIKEFKNRLNLMWGIRRLR